jgi:hypothetical protein
MTQMRACENCLIMLVYVAMAVPYPEFPSSRLLKNAHLLRLRSSCFTAAYEKYASFHMITHALHPSIFEQPVYIDFFKALLGALLAHRTKTSREFSQGKNRAPCPCRTCGQPAIDKP